MSDVAANVVFEFGPSVSPTVRPQLQANRVRTNDRAPTWLTRSRLRRRYADAPAGAPRGAPPAPAGARRRFPPASKSGLLAAFIASRRSRAFARLCRRDERNDSVGHTTAGSACGPRTFRHESGGQEFESLRARHFGTELGTPKLAVFALDPTTSVRSSALFDPMMRTSFASTSMRWASARR